MDNLSVPRFWGNYIEKTRTYNIKPKVARWYVRHAEAYIKAHASQRLARHGAQDLENYLRVKSRNPHLQDWRFRQVVEALRILFVDLVQAPWAGDFPWSD